MRGPTQEQRAEARRAYESGEPLKTIAKRLTIDPKTIRSWRDQQGWAPPPIPLGGTDQEDRAKAIKSNVIAFATGKAIEHLEASGAVEQQADLIGKALQTQGRISDLLMQYAETKLKDALANKIQPGERQSEADVMNAVVSAVSKAVSASRDIGGLKAGQISARAVEDDGRRRFSFSVVDKGEDLAQAS